MNAKLLASFPPLPIEIDHATGCEIIARDGRHYLDLYGGHCVCSMGHSPKGLQAALMGQMQRITFYSAALALPEREQAAEDLLNLAPAGFDRVFFVNSGAEANENALKFAFALTERSCVVAIEGAFHGRTAGVDPLCVGPQRKPHFPNAPFTVRWVPFGDAAAMRAALSLGDVAAVILEPVQSMAGCRVQPPEVVAAINEMAGENGTLVIADEIQGGVGRCIDNWSHQSIRLRADIMTVAKGVGGGFPVSAMIARSALGDPPKGLFGSTFGGGPLACVAVSFVCGELAKPELRASLKASAQVFDQLGEIAGVDEVLGIGLLRGIRVGPDAAQVKSLLLREGFIVGASSDPEVLRLMPPLTLPAADAQRFASVLAKVLAEI